MRWSMLALTLLLAVAACSGGDDDDQRDEPPTATATTTSLPAVATLPSEPTATTQIVEPTPTSEPTASATEADPTETEARATATDNGESGATTTSTAEDEAEAATATSDDEPEATQDDAAGESRPEDELALSLLLEESDLPEDWILVEKNIGDDEDSEEGLCGALPISDFATPTGTSEARFQISDGGPFIQEAIGLFETEQDAIDGIEYIRDSLTCTEWTQIDDGEQIDWTLAPIEMPDVGDDRVGYEISVGDSSLTLQGDYMLLRQGRALVLLVTFAVGEPVPFETAIIAAEAAVERVADGL